MATYRTYMSSISVPVYASWKCPYCKAKNFSVGNIVCERRISTTSIIKYKQEDAKNEALNRVRSEWKQNALNIILYPKRNPKSMRSGFFLQNTKCIQCGKKPKWDKDMGYVNLLALSFMPAIFSGLIAIGLKTSWKAWLIFAAFLGVIIYCIINDKTYEKAIKNMQEEYLPVIGSLNEELLAYAELRGQRLPSPEETLQIVDYCKSMSKPVVSVRSTKIDKENKIEKTTATSIGDKQERCFCGQCGAKLSNGSAFCGQCGAKVNR